MLRTEIKLDYDLNQFSACCVRKRIQIGHLEIFNLNLIRKEFPQPLKEHLLILILTNCCFFNVFNIKVYLSLKKESLLRKFPETVLKIHYF